MSKSKQAPEQVEQVTPTLIEMARDEQVEKSRRVYVDVTSPVVDPDDAAVSYVVQREQRADGTTGALELCTRAVRKMGTSEQRVALAPIGKAHRAFAEEGIRLF